MANAEQPTLSTLTLVEVTETGELGYQSVSQCKSHKASLSEMLHMMLSKGYTPVNEAEHSLSTWWWDASSIARS